MCSPPLRGHTIADEHKGKPWGFPLQIAAHCVGALARPLRGAHAVGNNLPAISLADTLDIGFLFLQFTGNEFVCTN